MCGRYALTAVPVPIGDLPCRILGEPQPNTNISPGSTVAIGRLWEQSALAVGPARWGLVPHWVCAKADGKPDFPVLFNARNESIATKPSFRRAYANLAATDPHAESGRCVVPMTGWYEWAEPEPGSSAAAQGRKQPYKMRRTDRDVFYCAGLFSIWSGYVTATIVTTEAVPTLQWLHDRMPLVFGDDDAALHWLMSAEPARHCSEVGNVISAEITSI